MDTITRKTLLYKTGVEYGDYTLNHILGCSHGCNYPCYAQMLNKRFGRIKTYDEWLKPKLVSNALELLDKEIPKMKDKIKSVHLCFMSDPFMYNYPEIEDMSIKIISKLNSNGIPCTILTKGLLPERLDSLSEKNEYGITLVSLNEDYRLQNEPGASPYKDRIESLRYLNNKGFKTWVSIEPYPTPNIISQNFLEILEKIKFVDKIIFGRLNYNSKVTQYKNYQIFYNQLVNQVKYFCENNSIEYYIKHGTYKSINK